MSSVNKRLADFGPFTFDCSQHILLRGEDPIDLSSQPAAILKYLIENPSRWISKDELRNQFWPNVHVTDNNIHQQISEIRRALGDSPHQPRFIETKHKYGWRFIASVSERTEADVPEFVLFVAPAGDSGPAVDARERLEGQAEAARTTSPSGPSVAHNNRYLRVVFLAILVATAGVGLAIWGTTRQEARVVNFTQLTDDGKPKAGPLLTDGQHIFFVEMIGGSDQAVSIPVSGGEPIRLPLSLSNVRLEDISCDGSKLLLESNDADRTRLWSYSISSRSLRPLGTGSVEAAWSPDGQMLAASVASGSSIQIPGGPLRTNTELHGRVLDLKWAPNGTKLRFSLLDPGQESSSEWEIAQGNGGPQRLAAISDGQPFVKSGIWSQDSKYFFYEAGTYWRLDIWVWPESTRLLSFHARRPLRLTNGEPGSWRWPSPAPNPSTLFALNYAVRSELVDFDRSTSSWQPKWDGAADFELDYSRDSQWVAYTNVRDHTIWKARSDRSGRVQLTEARIEAHQPHWSPDGTRIAFTGKNAKGQWRVFQVPTKRGSAEELLPSGEDQGVPTWSPDGRFVIFGERLSAKSRAEMSIHLLDITTRRLSAIAGTKGLWSPRWSPDGRYVAALTSDSRAIRVVRWPGTQWGELARMKFVDNVTWSPDSRYIQFNAQDKTNHWWLFRLVVPDGRPERIIDLANFTPATENWYGVDRDGTPLAFRGVKVQEIYALRCVLP